MIKVCKIRFYPNQTQIKKINQIFGGCRYVMNLYIEYNNRAYRESKEFISGYDFSKIVNKLKKKEEYSWLNDISSKALKDAIMTQEKAYKNYFRKMKLGLKTSLPRFKSRKRMNKESFFFIKDSIKFNTTCRNTIKIPILHSIRITEHQYLPDIGTITSGRVIREYDKYYVMFIYNSDKISEEKNDDGMGIDVGVKNYASIALSNGNVYVQAHFKDNKKYQSISDKIQYYQRLVSRKVEINYKRLLDNFLIKHPVSDLTDHYKNIMKGESYNTSAIKTLMKKLRKLHVKKANIRKDFIKKLVYKLVVRTKPKYITIEDLSITNMLANDESHELHKYISESGFYYFRACMVNKCKEYKTELRIADRYFASSKTCSNCGNKKKDLTLSCREYHCEECGLTIDRDINAAVNLLRTKKYSIV